MRYLLIFLAENILVLNFNNKLYQYHKWSAFRQSNIFYYLSAISNAISI